MSEEREFKTGDMVRLKIGGPRMEVDGYQFRHDYDGKGQPYQGYEGWICRWTEGDQMKIEVYAGDLLEKAPDEEEAPRTPVRLDVPLVSGKGLVRGDFFRRQGGTHIYVVTQSGRAGRSVQGVCVKGTSTSVGLDTKVVRCTHVDFVNSMPELLDMEPDEKALVVLRQRLHDRDEHIGRLEASERALEEERDKLRKRVGELEGYTVASYERATARVSDLEEGLAELENELLEMEGEARELKQKLRAKEAELTLVERARALTYETNEGLMVENRELREAIRALEEVAAL